MNSVNFLVMHRFHLVVRECHIILMILIGRLNGVSVINGGALGHSVAIWHIFLLKLSSLLRDFIAMVLQRLWLEEFLSHFHFLYEVFICRSAIKHADQDVDVSI